MKRGNFLKSLLVSIVSPTLITKVELEKPEYYRYFSEKYGEVPEWAEYYYSAIRKKRYQINREYARNHPEYIKLIN